MSWQRWVGSDGAALGLHRFGASAPYKQLYEHLGLTVDKVVETAKQLAQSGG
jgi:transketolase